MAVNKALQKIRSEIEKGMKLSKCRRCGCMKGALENILETISFVKTEEAFDLIRDVEGWLNEMETIEYSCLGCKYCFPAVSMNILTEEFPSLMYSLSLNCNVKVREKTWPPVPGEYFVLCEGASCPVAVSTLASPELAETLADIRPAGLCIVGKTETENIGIDKIIKNTITNPAIRYLIIAGEDPEGHYSGRTLLALCEKGVDADMKVIGSPGRRPVLKNVSFSEIEAFRKQVQAVDLIGCKDTEEIINKIDELSRRPLSAYECTECAEPIVNVQISTVPKITAREPKNLKMDKAGYFVVIPSPEEKVIVVEHYSYDNKLLHNIEGKDASSIYSTIIDNGWITELSHAAYLGRELAKAEMSLNYGFKYIQDRAPGKDGGDVEE